MQGERDDYRTVILWASELSDSNGHASTNDVHTSLQNAFGIADQTLGNPAYCDGPLAELL